MSGLDDAYKECAFESIAWYESNSSSTPAITPGPLCNANRVDETGMPIVTRISAGIHWTPLSYPAWMGLQLPRDLQYSQSLPSTPSALEFSMSKEHAVEKTAKLSAALTAPFGVDHIARTVDQIRGLLGFQFDASLNVFELFMSQLESRASRSCPKAALKSLHADYIGGRQANFRKWYFACEMDAIDRIQTDEQNLKRDPGTPNSNTGCSGDDEIDLENAEAIWAFRFGVATDEQRLEEVLLYLFCWTEANQVRFMPECLDFIVKCAREYYYCRRNMGIGCNESESPEVKSSSESMADIQELQETYFLDHIITPLYDCYRSYNFFRTGGGEWIRKEGDHKNFIGYDDMNQLFWYRSGLESIMVSTENGESVKLVSFPQNEWFVRLQDVKWTPVFIKTYRESRSWLHMVTNFSRVWILHASVFWFYTSFNSPSLYTVGYNYMKPTPPQHFVRLTVMSFGGLFGPLLTLIALLGELRFIPRNYPGAKPILARLIAVLVMFSALCVPAVINLTLNDWSTPREKYDLVPATVISWVLFAQAIVYTIYFSFQPLDGIFGGKATGASQKEADKAKRKYLANTYFTARFAKLSGNDWIVSWLMCLLVFTAKFLESYFFLTLSLKDPIRELDIMSLEDKCVGDKFLIGNLLCRYYPKIVLAITILTDMALFFLDTYLWYVIFNTIISVCIAVSGGTSIWTPWRNIYSRLSKRISSKLVVSGNENAPQSSCASALRIIWASIVEGMYEGNLLTRDQATKLTRLDSASREPSFFTMNEDGSTITASAAACRRISFFAQSLSTPMEPVMAVHEMPSFTVMVPHYKEKIILSLREAINTGDDSKVTTLDYLRKLYPVEWENFVLREGSRRDGATTPGTNSSLTAQSKIARQEYLNRVGFSTWDPNDTNPTRLWSSERSQTLYRTVRGFHNYLTAIKVLYYAENLSEEQEAFSSREDIAHDVGALVKRKFQLIVAMQLYREFTEEQLQDVETLFGEFPGLSVSYVEHECRSDTYFSCIIDSSCPLLDTGKRQPRMKIKLSGNPCLGDGKSDNQNSALIFYRGEYIQLIDANQDNYLEECLKIRNVLMEFEPKRSSIDLSAQSARCYDDEAAFEALATDDLEEESPVAIVGAREYIFSENIGVLGDVAAGKEQTFGTLFARTLAKIGGKLHYGHPDILNAIFMTTRGGVSKGQRGLHLNEDIYAGITAILRGGRIRHSEYFQCGKGRDLGFVSILNFTAKIGAGMGEQMLSREYFYMGSQLPFDRFISFYYAHPGFHLNNVFIMLSLEMLLVVTLWFASIASVSTLCTYDRDSLPTEPHLPAGCKNILPLLDWTRRCVVSIFLVFFVSLCPLFFQEVNEKGFFRSVKRILKHFCSLSMLFEIFVCRIYARSFWEDLNIGGAKYVATGRGLATARVPFHRLYAGYRLEIMTGFRAVGSLIYASIALWHPSYLWFWVTTFSLCMCPFLFNPHQFAKIDFFVDYSELLRWYLCAVTSSNNENQTWSRMVKSHREKLTGVRKRTQTSQSTRPSFRNTLFSQLGVSLVTAMVSGIPYVYVDTQKMSRHQSQPESSAILRVLFVSLLPLAANCAAALILFLVSVSLHLAGAKGFGNYIAAVHHTFSLCTLIVSWWLLYILERQRLLTTLLGLMTAMSTHSLLETLFTVLFLRRQRDAKRTNDPWWTGNWASARLGWKSPVIVLEELFVKSFESVRFTYDFLASHFLLCAQIPLVCLPFVDRIHCLFLLWLPPSICADAFKNVSASKFQLRKRRAQVFCGAFVCIIGVLAAMIALPFYLPASAMDVIADFVDNLVPWNTIK